jgi:hypothetical protein
VNAPVSLWDWYRRALASPDQIGTDALPVHPDTPQIGYYRMRRGGAKGMWDPVAIFAHGAELMAVIGPWKTGDRKPAVDVWASCCRFPVAHPTYVEVAQNGKPWPDSIRALIEVKPDPVPAAADADEAGIGHNSGKDPVDALTELTELADEVLTDARNDLQKLGPVDLTKWQKADADRMQNHVTAIRALKAKVEPARNAATQPLHKAWKDEVARWKPIEDRIEAAINYLNEAVQAFVRAEEARILAEREAAAKAERERQEAERARMSPAAQELLPEPKVEIEPVKVMVGTAGTRAGRRVVKVHKIVDLKACVAFILQNADSNSDFRETVQKIVNRMRHAGVTVPGVETVEE